MSGTFKRKALVLTWPEGHELYGLEVKCRRPSIAQVERVERAEETNARDGDAIRRLLAETIGSAILAWNYVDEDDHPVSATPDGFLSIDLRAQMEILGAWAGQSTGVPEDLGKGSGSGQPSPVARSSIPVTERRGLSDALASLPMHSERSESSSASPATP